MFNENMEDKQSGSKKNLPVVLPYLDSSISTTPMASGFPASNFLAILSSCKSYYPSAIITLDTLGLLE